MSDKKTYRVRTWKDYNKTLVQRGSLTLWICENFLEKWRACGKTGKREHPESYPDEVIPWALQMKSWYHFTFRALEGFLGSLIEFLKLDLKIPHDSFGGGEWKVRQHGTVKKRLWRNLHVAVNQENHMIEACVLTDLGIVKDC